MTLRTWDFGTIRIVAFKDLTIFDRFIRSDASDQYDYYQLTDGEIVAVSNWED